MGLGVVFHCTAVVSLLFPIVVAISESDKLPVPLHEAFTVQKKTEEKSTEIPKNHVQQRLEMTGGQKTVDRSR